MPTAPAQSSPLLDLKVHRARPDTFAFAWQGWQTTVPSTWHLIKLDGGYHAGQAVFAEDHRPRLLLRWTPTPRARRSSTGKRAIATTLLDDDGTHRVPTITETPPGVPTPWSVFNLVCTVPAGFTLRAHTLNAGDLSLDFTARHPNRSLSIRQLTPARLALGRMSLPDWLSHYQVSCRQYRASAILTPIQIHPDLTGISRPLTRRRRFFFSTSPARLINYALHDTARDRLLLIAASDDDLGRQFAATVGLTKEGQL